MSACPFCHVPKSGIRADLRSMDEATVTIYCKCGDIAYELISECNRVDSLLSAPPIPLYGGAYSSFDDTLKSNYSIDCSGFTRVTEYEFRVSDMNKYVIKLDDWERVGIQKSMVAPVIVDLGDGKLHNYYYRFRGPNDITVKRTIEKLEYVPGINYCVAEEVILPYSLPIDPVKFSVDEYEVYTRKFGPWEARYTKSTRKSVVGHGDKARSFKKQTLEIGRAHV